MVTNDWLMLQNRRFYVRLNEGFNVTAVIYNKGDLETNPQQGTKQNWNGFVLVKDSYISYSGLPTFSDVRQLLEQDITV